MKNREIIDYSLFTTFFIYNIIMILIVSSGDLSHRAAWLLIFLNTINAILSVYFVYGTRNVIDLFIFWGFFGEKFWKIFFKFSTVIYTGIVISKIFTLL